MCIPNVSVESLLKEINMLKWTLEDCRKQLRETKRIANQEIIELNRKIVALEKKATAS